MDLKANLEIKKVTLASGIAAPAHPMGCHQGGMYILIFAMGDTLVETL